MPYKVYPGKDTLRVQQGSVMKINLIQKINDSVYFSTQGKLPIYIPAPFTTKPYDLSEVWMQLKKGDSMVATQMMDTFMARSPSTIPAHFKKGDRILTFVKILDVFPNDSLAQADNKKLTDQWLANEVAFIQKYLAEKNIQAQKTPSGAFVEIKEPGSGNLIDSGNYITVNYTGATFAGVIIDSNTDTAFHHVAPYSYVTGAGEMIKGFDEGMRFLRKGAKARFYIPSILAYAGTPTSPKIKPFENLIFDIEILDVKEKRPDQPPINMNMNIPGQ